MPKKEIYCSACGRYLGIIRDAKLRKGIVFLCIRCETKRIASDMKKKPDLGDLFGGIFK